MKVIIGIMFITMIMVIPAITNQLTVGYQSAYAQSTHPAGVPLPTTTLEEVKPPLPVPPTEKSSVVQSILDYLNTIPAVGKVLSVIFQVLSILVVTLTALASILIALAAGLKKAGLDKAVLWINSILPWIKYLSMYNVQKDELKKKEA